MTHKSGSWLRRVAARTFAILCALAVVFMYGGYTVAAFLAHPWYTALGYILAIPAMAYVGAIGARQIAELRELRITRRDR